MSAEAFAFCPRCAQPLAERPIADDGGTVLRRACVDDCGFVQWGNPTPAVGALVEHEGEIILARNRAWPAGWFALVTGYLEAREDPKAAVAAGWGNIDPDITMGLVAPIIAGAVFFIARRARRALTQDEGSA